MRKQGSESKRDGPTATKTEAQSQQRMSAEEHKESKTSPSTVPQDDRSAKKRQTMAVGFDLGTSYCCVACVRNGHVETLSNVLDRGTKTMPSMVAFTETDRLVGDAAKDQISLNARQTIVHVKRMLGKEFNDATLQRDRREWPFEVVDDKGKPMVRVLFEKQVKDVRPEEIQAALLQRMKSYAETFLDETIEEAVITVPAYFTEAQRQATKDAAAICKLRVLNLIHEPTAAAIAYGLDRQPDRVDGQSKYVLVIDLGGGTLDVSLLEMKLQNGKHMYTVKATNGDPHLGGEDIDSVLTEHFAAQFERKVNKTNLRSNARAMRRLRTACEQAKVTLSTATTAPIQIDSLHEGMDFSSSLSRARFQEICHGLFQRVLLPIEQVLTDAKIAAHLEASKQRMDHIVLVGGSTRIPRVQELVKQFFHDKPLCQSIHPDEAVAQGAAIWAHVLRSKAQRADSKEAKHGKEQQESEACLPLIELRDVTPLTLGIETAGGVFTPIVPRNTPIPCMLSRKFTTHADDQTAIQVQVFQTERLVTEGAVLLKTFSFDGLLSAQRSPTRTRPVITVHFILDANGSLFAEAVELATGRTSKRHEIQTNGSLTPERIRELIEEADRFREQDARQQQLSEARNQFELLLSDKMRTLEDKTRTSKLSAAQQGRARRLLTTTRQWLDDHMASPSSVDALEQLQRQEAALETEWADISDMPTTSTE